MMYSFRLLIQNGADLSFRADGEMTALMDAAWEGRSEMVQLLIESGADINATNNHDMSSLWLAARQVCR